MLGFRPREVSVNLPGSQNRFHNWSSASEVLAIGQQLAHARGTIQLIVSVFTVSRRIMKRVLGTVASPSS